MIDDSRPEWWAEIEQWKAEMELPPYEPPRFEDGTYAYEVVEALEDEHGCRVRLLGVNTHHCEDWEVRIDGDTAFEIGRRRDDNGNTIYMITANQFEAAVREHVEGANPED
jgi:hypothetical protein